MQGNVWKQAVAEEGLLLTRNLPIVEGAEELRVAVRDGSSGVVGSVTVPMGRLTAGVVKGVGVRV